MTTTLTDDELARIKAELLDNVLSLGAEPYVSIRAIYDVIRDNVVSSSVSPTTSSTAVSAAGPTTITLASATGYAAGQRIVLDVDGSREVVTLRSLSGAVASVICRKTHSGTYPVEVESALTIVRGLLSELEAVRDQIADARASAGLRRVDEVEWMDAASGRTQLDEMHRARELLRRDLAYALGLRGIYEASKQSGVGRFEVY